VCHAVQRLVQRFNNAGVVQHVQRTAGALNRFFATQHVGPARFDQHQVAKTHDLHGAGGRTYVAGMAGVNQDKTGFHGRIWVKSGAKEWLPGVVAP
jgi:hypothetical protein